jgi:stage II sporulation protein D
MIKRMLIVLFSLVMLSTAAEAGVWDSISNFFKKSTIKTNDSLKILIVHDKPGAILEVKGKYKIYDPNTNGNMGKGYIGKRKYIQPISDGMKWGEEFPGVFQIMIMPDDKATTTIVDGIEYKGRIYVYDIGGSLSIVNEIPLDEYVKTVLSSKLQQPLPEEALAALAITARTNAYYMKRNARSDFWDIEAKQIGYQGYALSNPSSLIEKAIKATHNMIMNASSAPFQAQWDIVDATGISSTQPMDSKISIDQAAMLAHQGDHAAQILKKAFPNAQVDMIAE